MLELEKLKLITPVTAPPPVQDAENDSAPLFHDDEEWDAHPLFFTDMEKDAISARIQRVRQAATKEMIMSGHKKYKHVYKTPYFVAKPGEVPGHCSPLSAKSPYTSHAKASESAAESFRRTTSLPASTEQLEKPISHERASRTSLDSRYSNSLRDPRLARRRSSNVDIDTKRIPGHTEEYRSSFGAENSSPHTQKQAQYSNENSLAFGGTLVSAGSEKLLKPPPTASPTISQTIDARLKIPDISQSSQTHPKLQTVASVAQPFTIIDARGYDRQSSKDNKDAYQRNTRPQDPRVRSSTAISQSPVARNNASEVAGLLQVENIEMRKLATQSNPASPLMSYGQSSTTSELIKDGSTYAIVSSTSIDNINSLESKYFPSNTIITSSAQLSTTPMTTSIPRSNKSVKYQERSSLPSSTSYTSLDSSTARNSQAQGNTGIPNEESGSRYPEKRVRAEGIPKVVIPVDLSAQMSDVKVGNNEAQPSEVLSPPPPLPTVLANLVTASVSNSLVRGATEFSYPERKEQPKAMEGTQTTPTGANISQFDNRAIASVGTIEKKQDHKEPTASSSNEEHLRVMEGTQTAPAGANISQFDNRAIASVGTIEKKQDHKEPTASSSNEEHLRVMEGTQTAPPGANISQFDNRAIASVGTIEKKQDHKEPTASSSNEQISLSGSVPTAPSELSQANLSGADTSAVTTGIPNYPHDKPPAVTSMAVEMRSASGQLKPGSADMTASLRHNPYNDSQSSTTTSRSLIKNYPNRHQSISTDTNVQLKESEAITGTVDASNKPSENVSFARDSKVLERQNDSEVTVPVLQSMALPSNTVSSSSGQIGAISTKNVSLRKDIVATSASDHAMPTDFAREKETMGNSPPIQFSYNRSKTEEVPPPLWSRRHIVNAVTTAATFVSQWGVSNAMMTPMIPESHQSVANNKVPLVWQRARAKQQYAANMINTLSHQMHLRYVAIQRFAAAAQYNARALIPVNHQFQQRVLPPVIMPPAPMPPNAPFSPLRSPPPLPPFMQSITRNMPIQRLRIPPQPPACFMPRPSDMVHGNVRNGNITTPNVANVRPPGVDDEMEENQCQVRPAYNDYKKDEVLVSAETEERQIESRKDDIHTPAEQVLSTTDDTKAADRLLRSSGSEVNKENYTAESGAEPCNPVTEVSVDHANVAEEKFEKRDVKESDSINQTTGENKSSEPDPCSPTNAATLKDDILQEVSDVSSMDQHNDINVSSPKDSDAVEEAQIATNLTSSKESDILKEEPVVSNDIASKTTNEVTTDSGISQTKEDLENGEFRFIYEELSPIEQEDEECDATTEPGLPADDSKSLESEQEEQIERPEIAKEDIKESGGEKEKNNENAQGECTKASIVEEKLAKLQDSKEDDSNEIALQKQQVAADEFPLQTVSDAELPPVKSPAKNIRKVKVVSNAKIEAGVREKNENNENSENSENSEKSEKSVRLGRITANIEKKEQNLSVFDKNQSEGEVAADSGNTQRLDLRTVLNKMRGEKATLSKVGDKPGEFLSGDESSSLKGSECKRSRTVRKVSVIGQDSGHNSADNSQKEHNNKEIAADDITLPRRLDAGKGKNSGTGSSENRRSLSKSQSKRKRRYSRSYRSQKRERSHDRKGRSHRRRNSSSSSCSENETYGHRARKKRYCSKEMNQSKERTDADIVKGQTGKYVEVEGYKPIKHILPSTQSFKQMNETTDITPELGDKKVDQFPKGNVDGTSKGRDEKGDSALNWYDAEEFIKFDVSNDGLEQSATTCEKSSGDGNVEQSTFLSATKQPFEPVLITQGGHQGFVDQMYDEMYGHISPISDPDDNDEQKRQIEIYHTHGINEESKTNQIKTDAFKSYSSDILDVPALVLASINELDNQMVEELRRQCDEKEQGVESVERGIENRTVNKGTNETKAQNASMNLDQRQSIDAEQEQGKFCFAVSFLKVLEKLRFHESQPRGRWLQLFEHPELYLDHALAFVYSS